MPKPRRTPTYAREPSQGRAGGALVLSRRPLAVHRLASVVDVDRRAERAVGERAQEVGQLRVPCCMISLFRADVGQDQ